MACSGGSSPVPVLRFGWKLCAFLPLVIYTRLSNLLLTNLAAFQCLSIRFLRRRRTIRSHGISPNADLRKTSGGHFTRSEEDHGKDH